MTVFTDRVHTIGTIVCGLRMDGRVFDGGAMRGENVWHHATIMDRHQEGALSNRRRRCPSVRAQVVTRLRPVLAGCGPARSGDLRGGAGGPLGAPPQFLEQHVRRGGEQHPKLIGPELRTTCPPQRQPIVQFLEPVLHVAALTIDGIDRRRGLTQTGHDEAGIAVGCQGSPKFPQLWSSKIPHPG